MPSDGFGDEWSAPMDESWDETWDEAWDEDATGWDEGWGSGDLGSQLRLGRQRHGSGARGRRRAAGLRPLALA